MKRLSAADLVGYTKLSGGIFAVFAAGAVIAQLLNAPLPVMLAFAGIGLVGAIVALVLLWIEHVSDPTATAIELMLLRARDGTELIVMNRGLHVVRDIEISAFLAGVGFRASIQVPDLLPINDPRVNTGPMDGGWFLATVDRLSPTKGAQIARYAEDPTDHQRMSIKVQWNDHTGRQRERIFVGDLREFHGYLPNEGSRDGIGHVRQPAHPAWSDRPQFDGAGSAASIVVPAGASMALWGRT